MFIDFFKVMVEKTKFKNKPTSEESAEIINNLKKDNCVKIFTNMESLLNFLVEGHTISVGVFNGGHRFPTGYQINKRTRKKIWYESNFKESWMVMFDFDNNVPIEETKNLLEKYGFIVNGVYTSFSDSPEFRKYRFSLVFDKPFTNYLEYEEFVSTIIKELLLKQIPDCVDTTCKNFGRIFFGGKEIIHTNNEVNSLDFCKIVMDGLLLQKEKDRLLSLGKKVDKIPNKDRVLLKQDILEDCDSLLIKHYPFKEALEEFEVVEKFSKGVHQKYKVIFGLATNFVKIEGGKKWMKDLMILNNSKGLSRYNQKDFDILENCSYKNYGACKLKNFSPYEKDLNNTTYEDVLDLFYVRKRGFVDDSELKEIKKNMITLVEAEKRFDDDFNNCLKSTDKKVHLFIVPAGMGKTEKITDLNNVIIGFPNHKLKNEVHLRMKENTNSVIFPELPNFSDYVKNILNMYYSCGLYKRALSYIYQISLQGDEIDKNLSIKYIDDLNRAYQTKNTTLTTHNRLITSDYFTHNTYIFDEDPLQNLLKIDYLPMAKLEKYMCYPDIAKEYQPILDELKRQNERILYRTPRMLLRDDKAEEISQIDLDLFYENTIVKDDLESDDNEGSILSLMRSNFLIRTKNKLGQDIIMFVKKNVNHLEDKKIIILSASANEKIYRKLFGDRLVIYNYSNVVKQGSVLQFTKKTFSNQSLTEDLKKAENISKLVGNMKVITFKNKRNCFSNPTEMYFWNCSGFDGLKNLDIGVVGTPMPNPEVVLLIAECLDYCPDSQKIKLEIQNYNGCKFMFKAYQDKFLKQIQFALIESELIQAVGRNRTLRNKCVVCLFSGFPLKESDDFIQINLTEKELENKIKKIKKEFEIWEK